MIEVKVPENIQSIKSTKKGYVLVNPEGKYVRSITVDYALHKVNVNYSDIAEYIHIYPVDFLQDECNGFLRQIIKDYGLISKPVTYTVDLTITI